MRDADDGGRVLPDLGERRAPFRDRTFHRLEQADLPAILPGLLLHGVGDVGGIDAGREDHRHLVVGALVAAHFLELLHEFQEARAIQAFRRIALERAEVAVGIGLDQVVWPIVVS